MATSKVGVKKSLFKKPAWASTAPKITDKDDSIFGQAHHYQEIVKAEKSRRERNITKQREREARDKQQEEERQSKKRRILREDGNSDCGSDGDARSDGGCSILSQKSLENTASSPKDEVRQSKRTPQNSKSRVVDRLESLRSPHTRLQKKLFSEQEATVILDDEDGLSSQRGPTNSPSRKPRHKTLESKKQAKQAEFEPESEEEDEYLRELKARARDEARSKRLGTIAGKEATPDSGATPLLDEIHSPPSTDILSPSLRTERSGSWALLTTKPEDEGEVKIWIKTIIPGAREVIVNRKISQPLDKVKEFWIRRNELEPAIAQKVFFTWNGTRLYNSTTMRGIIERLKKAYPAADGSDPSDGKIILEAVTDEIFEYRQKQREMKLAEMEGQASNDQVDTEHDHDDVAKDEASRSEKPGIVIKLKAQGYEDMPIRVRPNTSMHKILAAFRHVRGVDQSLQSWLSYDGDRLDGETTVDEIGLEQDDAVEVYIR